MSFDNLRLDDGQIAKVVEILGERKANYPLCNSCNQYTLGMMSYLTRVNFGKNNDGNEVAVTTLTAVCSNCGNIKHYALPALGLDYDEQWSPVRKPSSEGKGAKQ